MAAAAALLITTTGSSATGATQAGDSIRALVSRPDGQSNGIWWAKISGNAKTAFVWTRDDLLGGLAATERYRLFAVDIATNEVRLVSDDGRLKPQAVSHDGSFLVATYELSNTSETAVIVDATNGALHQLDIGEPLTFLREATISADGTTVAFAATTGRGATLSSNRLFVADVATGAVSEPLAGSDGSLFALHLDSDGTTLAFASQASNLSLPPGPRGSSAVIYDRVAGSLEYAYETTDGGVPNGQFIVDGISSDGSAVLLRSGATNLVGVADGLEPTGSLRPFIFDRSTGVTTAVESPGLQADQPSVATRNADLDVVVLFDAFGTTAMVVDVQGNTSTSLYGQGVEPDGPLWTAALEPISMDASGDVVVLLSQATNLGPDRDDVTDAFIVGAAPVDPNAEPYIPPRVELPPTLLSPTSIDPTPIEPTPIEPTPIEPSHDEPPPADPPAADPPPGESPGVPSSPSSTPEPTPRRNPMVRLGCTIDASLGLDVLGCGSERTVVDAVVDGLWLEMMSD